MITLIERLKPEYKKIIDSQSVVHKHIYISSVTAMKNKSFFVDLTIGEASNIASLIRSKKPTFSIINISEIFEDLL